MYGLTVVTPPAAEPVSPEEAKHHLRVEHGADDAYISALVAAARSTVEDYTRRAFVTQTLKMTMDAFPDVVRLPRAPVQSVSQVTYLDTGGVSQVLDSSKYRVDSERLVTRITPAYGEVWPATRPVTRAVELTFVAGYGAASAVPAALKQAILLLVGTYYDPVRQTVIIGQASKLPHAADYLAGPYRVLELA